MLLCAPLLKKDSQYLLCYLFLCIWCACVCVCVRAALLNVAALQENVLSLVFHWSQYTEDNSQISVHLLKCAVKIGLITKCVQAATATAKPHFIFIDIFCLRIFNRYPVFFTTPECLHRFELFQPQIIATKCSQSLVISPPVTAGWRFVYWFALEWMMKNQTFVLFLNELIKSMLWVCQRMKSNETCHQFVSTDGDKEQTFE